MFVSFIVLTKKAFPYVTVHTFILSQIYHSVYSDVFKSYIVYEILISKSP